MPFEPEVRPWSGVSAVSPSTNLILSTPMPSSSAAICGIAMRSPWPRSTLPQNKVTVPSPFTARKASTSLTSSTRAAPGAPCAKAPVRNPVSAKPTVSAPPLRTARREKRDVLIGAFMSASLSGCRHYRPHHPHMGSAAAEISVKRRANFALAGLLLLRQQRGRAHDHAAGAVAALRHLLLDEGGLDRVRRRCRAESLERGYSFASRIRDRKADRIAWPCRRSGRCK